MPAIRDFAVTEVTTATTTATPDMPIHESGDLLIVFANKDSSPAMTETSGLYTLGTSSAISTTGWMGVWWRRATSNDETPPSFTWTSETANFVIVSVKNVHATNNPTFYLSSNDATIPFTQDQSISTPSNNCLVLHGVGTGNATGIGVEPYPAVAQVLYGGDAGANGVGVSWAFYPTAGSIGNPTFWGRAETTTRIITVVIEDNGSNTEVQGYVDRGVTPCTIINPMVGSTLFGWAHQTALSLTMMGKEWDKVWYFNASTYADETVDMNNATTADVPLVTTVGSILYLGSLQKFNRFCVKMSTATAGGAIVWEYWNGTTWATLSGVTHTFNSTTAFYIVFNKPSNWATTQVNTDTEYYYYIRQRVTTAKTTAGTASQSRIDGVWFTYDAITSTADYGVNPYHNVAQITPSSTTYGLGGNEILYSGGLDMTSGYLLGTFLFTAPRDWVDLAFSTRIGIILFFLDTSNNYKAWRIGAKDSSLTFPDRRQIYAIQLDQTEDTTYTILGTPTMTAIDTIMFLTVNPYGTMGLCFSMLIKTGNIVLSGGTAADPLNFDKMIDAIINGCCLFPMLYKLGSAATVWSPIRIGGGDPVHVSLNFRTFQFPTHASASNKLYDFHVDSNKVGIDFYGKSGDTIKVRNCVFTSDSPYYWSINASAVSGATWDFSGTSIIKAKVTLRNVMTFNEMTFRDCSEISVLDCTLSKCSVSGAPTSGNGLTVNNNSVILECEIDTTSVDAGNSFMQTATPDKISDSIFNGATNKGHAIKITQQGTYTFDGNKFNNYGANGTTSAAIFNDSSGLVTLNITGGGDTPTVRNGAGASTTINNAVTLTVRKVKTGNEPTEYVRCAIYKASDMSEIMNKDADQTDDQNPTYYKATQTYNFTGNVAVIVRARETGYLPFETTATITANGLDITAVWIPDPNYNP